MSTDDPIQNIERFDLVGKRNDGGVDVVIVVSAPLLDSAHHRSLVTAKIDAYARAIGSPQFRPEFDMDEASPIRVLVVSDHAVAEGIRGLIRTLEPIVESVGARLVLTTSDQMRG